MKAKVKATGEIVEVCHTTVENFDYVDLELSWSKGMQIRRIWKAEELITPEDVHWQNIRERAAIAVLQGMGTLPYKCGWDSEDCTNFAINCADNLVERLKEEPELEESELDELE